MISMLIGKIRIQTLIYMNFTQEDKEIQAKTKMLLNSKEVTKLTLTLKTLILRHY